MEQKIQSYNRIFWDLIQPYGVANDNLLRKMIHSYEVARNCFTVACQRGFSERERHFCYLMGLLHDLGRFEQWITYQTFDDRKSVDHGELSYEMLKSLDCGVLFNLTKREVEILQNAIRYHTKPYLDHDLDVVKFNRILQDCDAFSNVITVANGMQQMTVQEDGVTPEILSAFKQRALLIIFSPRTKLDRCLALTACCYYVQDQYLRKQIVGCNYLEIIYETFSQYLNEVDKKVYRQAIDDLKIDYLKK